MFNIFWAWQTRSVSVLILGVGLLAECILAIGPFDDSVAAVEHPCQLPPAPLDTIHRVVFAPHLPVVERARGRLGWLLVERGEDFGGTPLAVMALAPAATSTCSPFSASAAATTAVSLLSLALLGVFPLGRGLFLRSDGSPRSPSGAPLGLYLVCVHEGQLLHPVRGIDLHDVVDEVAQ